MREKGDALSKDADAKTARAVASAQQRAKQRAAKAAAETAASEQKARRATQFAEAELTVGTLVEHQRDVVARQQQRSDLANHMDGLYSEVDKLAKRMALQEVTDLVLGDTNQCIRDAKAIVVSDTHLDRVKEFVAAGNNPAHSDVLVTLRSVRQALERAEARMRAKQESVTNRLRESQTIEGALRLTMETGAAPTLRDVRTYAEHNPNHIDNTWFSQDEEMFGLRGADIEDAVFDLAHLDAQTSVANYLARPDEG